MKKNNTNKNILATSKTNIKKKFSKISLKKISLNKISKEQIKEHLAWVPNLFTFANLSLGFFAILFNNFGPSDERFLAISTLFIILAMLFDGFDGFAARLLNANSSLGAQLDSLADLVAFGIAPATLMYSNFLHNTIFTSTTKDLPLGMFIAAIWPMCAAYRLARFNIKVKTDNFIGLPSPIAGVIVALLPSVFNSRFIVVSVYVPITIFIFCAFLMVSTIKYSKPQITLIRKFSQDRLALIVSLIVFSLTFLSWRYGYEFAASFMLAVGFIYIITGLVSLIIHTIQKYRM